MNPLGYKIKTLHKNVQVDSIVKDIHDGTYAKRREKKSVKWVYNPENDLTDKERVQEIKDSFKIRRVFELVNR
jgi:hypothetical protein